MRGKAKISVKREPGTALSDGTGSSVTDEGAGSAATGAPAPSLLPPLDDNLTATTVAATADADDGGHGAAVVIKQEGKASAGLTRGGNSKKKFAPTVPVVRNKKVAPKRETETGSTPTRGGRGRSHDGRGRGRGRSGRTVYTQSEGIFSHGFGPEITRKKTAERRSSAIGGVVNSTGGSSSTSGTKSTGIRARTGSGQDKQISADKATGASSVTVQTTGHQSLESGNDTGVGLGYPHLPSAREKTSSPDIGMKRSRKPGARGKTIDDSPKATATARGLLLADMDVEEFDSDGGDFDDQSWMEQEGVDSRDRPVHLPLREQCVDGVPIPEPTDPHEPTTSAFSLTGEDGLDRMIFMQFPDVLPTTLSNGSAHGANELDPDSGDFLGDMDETCSMKNLGEGFMGKLRIRASGRMELQLGENRLVVTESTPFSFLQELVAIQEKKVVDDSFAEPAKLIKLGQLAGRFVAAPDVSQLLHSCDYEQLTPKMEE